MVPDTHPDDLLGAFAVDACPPAETDAVTEFNGEPNLRRCRNCGWEHPLGYRFMATKNSADEEAARLTW